MTEWWADLTGVMTSDRAFMLLRAAIIVLIGFLIARAARSALVRLLEKFLTAQQKMIVSRASYYLVLGLFFISAMHELGFSLGVLLGAAGIFSVAIGFASQTSASNLISGLFLIVERPFSVGDTIMVGDTIGEVLSIDLLSVKLRTPDNLYVRLPNETLIKSEVITMTKFPLRRVDLQLKVSYEEDIAKVRQLLLELAAANPLCLREPKPVFELQGFGEGASNIQFSVWVRREQLLEVKNAIQEEIKIAFERHKIRLPYSRHTVQIVEGNKL